MPRSQDRSTKNFVAKAFAVLAAVSLWAFANLQSTGQEAIQAAVRFEHVPAGLEINPDQIDSISVLLRGRRDRLRTLTGRGLVVSIDCSDVYGPGERTVNVDASSLGLPRSVEFIKAVPSQLRFIFEERAEKLVEVVPQFVGEIPAGYLLDGYKVNPPSLLIAGPAERVALVEQVSTDPISLAGEFGVRSFKATAFLPDPYLRFDSDAFVAVEVRMKRR